LASRRMSRFSCGRFAFAMRTVLLLKINSGLLTTPLFSPRGYPCFNYPLYPAISLFIPVPFFKSFKMSVQLPLGTYL
jgi:hypothetical protein